MLTLTSTSVGLLPMDRTWFLHANAGVWPVSRRLGLLTAVAAVLMGVARSTSAPTTPVTWPSGLLFGAVVTMMGYVTLRRVHELAVTRLEHTPARDPLASDPASEPTRPQNPPYQEPHR